MIYVRKQSCISAIDLSNGFSVVTPIDIPENSSFRAKEPAYSFIPAGSLRRMGKLVRMGLGASMPLIKDEAIDAIIMATSNAGKEDCVQFLEQILEYDEGMLTPLHFVQSTPNALAGQIGMLSSNHCYNMTHVHLGLSFENALLDAMLFNMENHHLRILLGAADDMSFYHEIYERKAGWVKDGGTNKNFMNSKTPGSVLGEAACMFILDSVKEGSISGISAIESWHGTDLREFKERVSRFRKEHLNDEVPYVLFSGENGDSSIQHWFLEVESELDEQTAVYQFKRYCGEFSTATAFALWLSGECFNQKQFPNHILKQGNPIGLPKRILIYNNYKGFAHSLILVEKPYQ